MILFIDNDNKKIYIVAPKCGNTTIARMLNVNLHYNYKNELDKLNNPEYTKIIVVRNVVDRFLSGFYEDFFNSGKCYNNMDITFDEYLLFLYKCYKEKIPNVNNINNIPLWWGKNQVLNITNDEGNFCSHIQSQKFAISHIINSLTCNNIQIMDTNNLSSITNIKENVKVKNIPKDFDISTSYLSYMKKNNIIISSNLLTSSQINIILEMYEDDVKLIHDLQNKCFNLQNF